MWSPDVMPVASPGASYRLIATPAVLAVTPAAAPYQLQPPLSDVWAGDDPDNPTQTVVFAFPDEATAKSVLAAYWTADTPI